MEPVPPYSRLRECWSKKRALLSDVSELDRQSSCSLRATAELKRKEADWLACGGKM